jgi:CPA1 family monovalent cation:H+ antiporter
MRAVGYGVLITVILIVTRLLTAFGTSFFTVWISRYITTADPRPGLKAPIIFGWAGMRGVVSLAAALSIPIRLSDGSPFPERNLILFITFMVILLTLVVQGLTLPAVIRWVNMEDPDHLPSANEQDNYLRKKLAAKSVAFLSETNGETLKTNRALQRLKERYEGEQLFEDEDRNNEQEDYRLVYIKLLEYQRNVLLEMNKKMETDENIIRKYFGMLDLEEEKLRIRYEGEED